jgi:hypothetical protein
MNSATTLMTSHNTDDVTQHCRHAADFLVDSLPAIPSIFPGLPVELLEQVLSDESIDLRAFSVGLRAKHSLYLIEPGAGAGAGAGVGAGVGGAFLHTNAGNGRAFAGESSPQFEVLPALIPAVRMLLSGEVTEKGPDGVSVLISDLILAVGVDEVDDGSNSATGAGAGAGAGVGVGAGAVGVNEINLENEVLDLLLLLADHGAVDIREALITGGGGSGSVQAAVPATKTDIRAGKLFVAAAALEAGAVQTGSGLVCLVHEPGAGAAPRPTDRVKVSYTGKLIDGTVFDASHPDQPVGFKLNEVIPGWSEVRPYPLILSCFSTSIICLR